jgi:DNA-binding transcriptional ArsR family regulator
MNLVDTFRAFSDPSRLRILHLLLQQPLCVCHLQELLDLPQVNISQHLACLRKNGLVEFTSVQTWKVYRLRSPMSRAVELSLRCLAESAKSDPVLSSDLKRLPKALKNSRFSSCGDPTVDRPRDSLSKGSATKL